jgi:hypothetical protein
MGLPDGCDVDKLAEVALGLMYLTLHGDKSCTRAWKGTDWDVLNLLHERGWIGDPKSKAKSVPVTGDGEALAERFFKKHFGRTE